jgi:hypothetical protein
LLLIFLNFSQFFILSHYYSPSAQNARAALRKGAERTWRTITVSAGERATAAIDGGGDRRSATADVTEPCARLAIGGAGRLRSCADQINAGASFPHKHCTRSLP